MYQENTKETWGYEKEKNENEGSLLRARQ